VQKHKLLEVQNLTTQVEVEAGSVGLIINAGKNSDDDHWKILSDGISVGGKRIER